MTRKWHRLAQPDAKKRQLLQDNLGIGPVTAGFLVQKGIETISQAKAFLEPSFDQLHDPFDFYQMDVAVERIQEAVFSGETILVYGDYDVDGLTSTTIMTEGLVSLGAEVYPYIPNRFEDGYGPNQATYERLVRETGASLIITVDNGVTGKKPIAWAKDQGVDVVVTDHHSLPEELPDAVAVIHPRHPKGEYPFGDLSGAGVAFKVVQAVLQDGMPAESLADLPTEFFDLVAMGAIADVVSLKDENRAFVTWGLKEIETNPRPGIAALLKTAKQPKDAPVLSETVGFKIAPRLNAIGRLGDASLGLDLLKVKDETEAKDLAKKVEELNNERRELVDQVFEEAKAQAMSAEQANQPVLLIAGKDWHQGVLGIVAARLTDVVAKPVVVMTKVDGVYKGSGRSYGDFDLHAFLADFQDDYTAFGGHAGALGMAMAPDKLEKVRARILQAGAELSFDEEPIAINLVMAPRMLTKDFYEQVVALEPFGEGNPQPVIGLEKVALTAVQPLGAEKKHLKLSFNGGRGPVEALAFNDPALVTLASGQKQATLAGTVGVNTFAGRTRLQLMIEDVMFPEKKEITPATPTAKKSAQVGKKRGFVRSKADFAKAYKYLYGHQEEALVLDLTKALAVLSLEEKEFKLMIQVFLDLGFVKMEEGHIRCLDRTEKRALDESTTYQRYFAG
ncbi:single-stranded-DNA-specific exonuclease RecJ [Fructobacillus sp. M1-13]|uniref:Single-stranded-DNA-specific exonuclease RecJ n=1 Tax=Fructobacillus papyriferae TaxID=2713171 RepID=A0ABS5QQ37_9LACO|nr:single-stranded-DNA-specific exonuclease RecJ [Fructobacillus papyriferae]MBS9334516.1 single-stranded-DNA-specific exonuclease RecJ [Fructobacillus papyriferae]MCD2158505.1 single-stranded-DNA-specific exonuclease RecJ [Fructobacillus papyriferae]